MEPPLIIYKSGPLHYLRWLVFTHSTVDYSYHKSNTYCLLFQPTSSEVFFCWPGLLWEATPYFEAYNSYRFWGRPTFHSSELCASLVSPLRSLCPHRSVQAIGYSGPVNQHVQEVSKWYIIGLIGSAYYDSTPGGCAKRFRSENFHSIFKTTNFPWGIHTASFNS